MKKKDLKIETNKNSIPKNQGQSKEKNAENQAKSKKKIFIEKFNIQKELLNRDDIKIILNELNPGTEENIQAQSDIIFEKLDTYNLGFVKTDDLIKSLISGSENKDADEELVDFYNKLNNILKTKSEEIMYRLKKLQNKYWIKNNKELSSKLKKVIVEITTQQLSDVILDDENIKKKQKEDVSFLMKYSQIEDNKQKAKDLQVFHRQSKKYSSYLDNNLNLMNSSEEIIINNTLSTMISPSVIAKLSDQMEKISSCDFDIFELNNLLGKKTSVYLSSEILGRLSLVDNGDIPQNILSNFIKEIVAHYDRNKAIYHNDLHAGDVMQTVYTIFVKGNLGYKMKLSELDIFSILIASLCHDFKHPGTNNAYNINARTKYAMRYNDLHVLESYHISQTFKVLSNKQFNIFQNFSPEEYRIARRRMIDAVISTDMAKHTKVVTAAKNKAELYDIVKGKNFTKIFEEISDDDSKNNKQLIDLYNKQKCLLNMIVHTSDISNPAKPDKISAQWTQRVYDEFFVQGDMEKEKKLPVSNFCDRNTTNVNKAMIGFISFVVGPTINCLVNLVPEVIDYKHYCESNLRKHQRGAKQDDKLLILAKNKKEEEERKNNKQ